MIRREDIVVERDGVTPHAGVYVTVKDADGELATIYDNNGALISGSVVMSDLDGSFAYNVAADGVFTEEYRLAPAASIRAVRAVEISTDMNVRTDLASTASGKGAALVAARDGGTVQDTVDIVEASLPVADKTFYVDPAGSDTTGNGTSVSPFATIQKAVDAGILLTGRKTVAIEVAAGSYATSSRSAASMDRPALVYIDGVKIGKRTDVPGGVMKGGLVIRLAAGAKITPNAAYPRGIYVTAHAGSVGISGGEVEAATGAESLIVSHRGAYVHCSGVTLDGNAIASLGLVCEAGGLAEMVNCTATGSTTDVQIYSGSFAQFASPGGATHVGKIVNNGTCSLGANVHVDTSLTHIGEKLEFVGGASSPTSIDGDYYGYGGQVIGAYANWTSSTARVEFHGQSIQGDVWKFDAQFHLFGSTARGNNWQSYIAGAASPHTEPMVLYGPAQFSGRYNKGAGTWGANSIINSAGVQTGPVYAQNVQTFNASAGTIALNWSGAQQTFVRVENTSGGTITNMVLAATLAANSRGGGDQPPDGSLWTFYTTSAQSTVIIPGSSIVTLPGGSITLGTAAGAWRLVTFMWSRALGKFQLVSHELNVQTAPTNTYVAPTGGTTVDAEARASLAQLAADLANLKTKTQAARIHA